MLIIKGDCQAYTNNYSKSGKAKTLLTLPVATALL